MSWLLLLLLLRLRLRLLRLHTHGRRLLAITPLPRSVKPVLLLLLLLLLPSRCCCCCRRRRLLPARVLLHPLWKHLPKVGVLHVVAQRLPRQLLLLCRRCVCVEGGLGGKRCCVCVCG